VVFGHGGDFTTALDLSSLDGTNGFKINAKAASGIPIWQSAPRAM
jgi:hypothetical protein